MSITGVNGYANYWPWQNQGTQSSTGAGAATTSSNSISNTGSVTAGSNVTAFMQTFSADLQSMLTQMGTAASSSGATASTTSATDPSQNPDAVHHHHHHHGQGGSMEGDAEQLVGEIGQSLQGGTLGTSQINQSASLLATDVMQALQSYGTSATNALALPGISTVA